MKTRNNRLMSKKVIYCESDIWALVSDEEANASKAQTQ